MRVAKHLVPIEGTSLEPMDATSTVIGKKRTDIAQPFPISAKMEVSAQTCRFCTYELTSPALSERLHVRW